MAGPVQIQLHGDKELRRALNSLDKKVQRKVLRQSLRRNAKTALTSIKAMTPVGDETEGRKHLRDLLRLVTRSRKGRITVAVAFPTREELGIPDDDPYFWPQAVESGHKAPGGKGRPTPAHPFIRPGWDSVESAMANRLSSDILDGVAREWAKQ